MKTITKKINLYTFDELSVKAKDSAVNDYVTFLLDCVPYEEGSKNYREAIDEAERRRTPWFTDSIVKEYCEEEIIETIKLNNYQFLKSGEIY